MLDGTGGSWLSCKRYTYERFGCRQTPTTMALILTRNAVSSSVSNKSCIIKHISKIVMLHGGGARVASRCRWHVTTVDFVSLLYC